MWNVLEILFVVSGNIPWIFGPFEFQIVLADDRLLDLIAASLIDRVGDICIKLVRSSFDILKILGTA